MIITSITYGQISPGELTNSHAEFEGISNCTLCHDIGKKVSNMKCLDCHDNISNLLDQNRGYHASPEVKNKDCFECHGEHYGRKFDMIRFDEINFNHELTGYKLEGKHEEIDCRKCHVSENIVNEKLKKNANTFLGLDIKCLSCHDDYHQETLSTNDCVSCHDSEAFLPATNFDHNDTDYTLKGEHKEVDCVACHEMSSKNGQEFQNFNNISFEDCKNCHEDPHNNQLKGLCKQCHTESSFSNFIGKGNFNHTITDFTLKGNHQKIDCFSCHAETNKPELVFQKINKVPENSCIDCHEDIHQGKFGADCVNCHNENSFTKLSSMDFFDHSKTDYILEGKHKHVDCKQCHKGKYTEAINFSSCNSCHEDYHLGEFTKNDFTPDCVECHSLDNGFDNSRFTLEEHQTTIFPLEGAHSATPCFACHISEENDTKWTFKNIGNDCIDCHQDIHQDIINKKYYPDNKCNKCHVNETWSRVNFDHNLTNWPLDGEHLNTNCSDCHFKTSDTNNEIIQQFSDLDSDCVNCHKNIHGNQFEINEVTVCKRCHNADSWFPENFNHDESSFKLEGRHAEIACNECHQADSENEQLKIYKIEKYGCIDCHQ